jgi:hypothetical protein
MFRLWLSSLTRNKRSRPRNDTANARLTTSSRFLELVPNCACQLRPKVGIAHWHGFCPFEKLLPGFSLPSR